VAATEKVADASGSVKPATAIDAGLTSAVPSASHVHSEAVSTGLHAVSTATSSVDGQTVSAMSSSSSSAGAELLTAAANPADGAVSSGHQVLSTSPTKLEVGVFDGTHGWLQIRAELGTSGTVNASLSTTSSAAHDAVKAAVPEMTSYLQSESVNVSRIAVHRIAEMPNSMSATAGDGQSSAQGQHSAHDNSGASQGSLSMASDTGSGTASGSDTRGSDTMGSAVSAISSDAASADTVVTSEDSSSAVVASDWAAGLNGAIPTTSTAWGGSSGSWLNVSA
jgi:hypothetical protein